MNKVEIEQEVYVLSSEYYWLCKQYHSEGPLSHARSVCERRAAAVRAALHLLGYGTDGKPLFEVV